MVTLLACIFVFGLLISVHEFGHFIFAKMTGMRVDEFSIGFGPKIYSNQEGETLYSLRLLPLGGYNKIAGMDPGEPLDERSFASKSVPKRMLVILAGSVMNLLLPILIFWGLFFINGMDVPTNEPVLGNVVPGYAAANAGLQAEDRILTINGQQVTNWQDVHDFIAASDGKKLTLETERSGTKQAYTLVPDKNPETGKPFIGVVAGTYKQSLGPVASFTAAVQGTVHIVENMVAALFKMVLGKTAAEVSGPIGVAKMAGEVAHRGIGLLLQFTALLSINLAVINLLPLPALDGGHFILLLWEGITGHKFGEKAMRNIQTVGVIMILALTIFATYKDLMR